MSKFDEQCSRINDLNAQIKQLRLTPFSYNIKYRNEAIKCFCEHLPISCIVVSSTLVEACLKWERFRRKPLKERKVIKLDEFGRGYTLGALFSKFIDSDVPLEKLLDADEDIELLRRMKEKERGAKIGKLRYVMIRNKYAHGDLFYQVPLPCSLISGHEQDWGEYGIDYNEWVEATFETVAYVHLFKTLRFMKAFANLLIQKYSS